MNALLPSATPTAAAGVTARSAVPAGDEPGAFAAVLGQRLRHAAPDPERDALLAVRAPRSATRKPQDTTERESVEANALPLIAAALESRSLAPVRDEAAAPRGGAPGAAVSALQGGAVPADTPPPRIAPGEFTATGSPESVVAAEAEPGVASPQRPGEHLARASAPDSASSILEQRSVPQAARPAPVATPAAHPAASLAPAIARPASDEAPATAAPTTRTLESAPARVASDVVPRALGDNIAAHRETSLSPGPAAPELQAMPHALSVAGSSPALAGAVANTPSVPVAGQGYVAPPVASQAWGAAVGQELARIHHAGHGQAQLELNPPGLGPLSVSLSVTDQQAHAMFVSPHPAVRAALEAALPQLRSALADSGISLGQASVGAEHQPGSGAFSQPSQDQAAQRRFAAAAFAAPEPAADMPATPPRSSSHVLDTFA